MKIITIGNRTVIVNWKADGKLTEKLKGKTFQHGLIIGSCRYLPIQLSHFEKGVFFIGKTDKKTAING